QKLLGHADALPRLTPNWEKRYLPLDGVQAGFEAKHCPIGVIYVLAPRTEEVGAPRIEVMTPKEALLELVQNTYMNWLLDREQRAREFDVLVRLVEQVPVRRLVPHRDASRIDALCRAISADAERLSQLVFAAPHLNPH